MFGNIKLMMDLQRNKDNPDGLAEIFLRHKEDLIQLKNKYPEWRNYLRPEVLAELKKKGLPVD